MATYLQGITDYIPQLQPFQPDYNFLANVLQTKQTRYDAAHKQLSSLYGTMLNSPMLREDNIEKRNEFFRSINDNIQRLSGVDLSLQQNVDQASELFKGLYEDKNIVKDMTWTKNWMNQREKGEMMKTCIDPEKCGGSWWEGGDKYLDYKAQEFKSASKDEAMNFKDVDYIAHQNITDKAIKAAKDAGFNVKYDEIKGDWIVHTKNGTKMIQPLAEFYVAKFGNDPRITQFYKAQAYLDRKDWVTQNITNYNNDENEANLAYVNQVFNTAKKTVDDGLKDAEQASDVRDAKTKQIDDHIKKNGYVPGMDWITDWNTIKEEKTIVDANKKVYKDANDQLANLGYNKDNIKYVIDNLDGLVGLDKLKRASLVAASEYSALTTEQTFTANPYAVQAKQQAFQASQARAKEGWVDANGTFHPGTDYYNASKLKQDEWERENKIQAALYKSLGLDYKTAPDEGGPATDVIKALSYTDNQNRNNELFKGISDAKTAVVETFLTQTILANKTSKADAKVLEGVIVDMIGTDGKSGINAKLLLAGDAAERTKFANYLKDPAKIDSIYSVANKYANPATSDGALNQNWLKDIKPQIDQYNQNIQDNQQFLEAHVEFTKKQGKTATDAYAAGLEKEGKTREAETFKEMYALLNTNGHYRANTGEREENRITEAARKYAAKYKEKYKHLYPGVEQPGVTIGPDGKPILSAVTTYRAGPQGGGNTTEKALEEYAKSIWKSAEKDWRQSYADNARHWTNPNGDKGTGKATMAYSAGIDAAVPTGDSAKDFSQMMQNYNSLKSQALVGYGNLVTKPESSDTSAQALLDAFYSDYVSGAKTSIDKTTGQAVISDKHRARGQMYISRIAAHDPNLVGFRVIPSEQWAEQYKSSKEKSKVIAHNDERYKEGIVVYLPKDKVKADFMDRTEYNSYDFLMDYKGQVKYNNPNAGDITVQRVGDMYQVTTTAFTYDDKGNKVADGKVSMHTMDLNLPTFMESMRSAYSYQEMANLQTLNSISGLNKGQTQEEK